MPPRLIPGGAICCPAPPRDESVAINWDLTGGGVAGSFVKEHDQFPQVEEARIDDALIVGEYANVWRNPHPVQAAGYEMLLPVAGCTIYSKRRSRLYANPPAR
jgi:hypothetical protein